MTSLFSRLTASRSTDAPAESTRRGANRSAKTHRRAAATLAIVCVGAMAGTGFVLEPAMAAQTDKVAQQRESADMERAAFTADAQDKAEETAAGTLAGASAVIAAAQNKADASQLTTTVAMLSNYEQLEPKRIYDLVDTANERVAPVQAATAEADRVLAEQAAAAQAAAEQAAAEQAAAEQAAAEKATADKAAADKAAAEKAAANKAAADKAAADKAAADKAAADKAAAAPKAQAAPKASTAPAAAASATASGSQAIARDMMASKYGWGSDQLGCLVNLWNKESGWNVNAKNASSGATGIPQALPGSKMASAGSDWATNPATQISWGLGYIKDTYGSPCAAWSKSQAVNWY